MVSWFLPSPAGAPAGSAGRLVSGGPQGRGCDARMSRSYSLGGMSPSSSCSRSWL